MVALCSSASAHLVEVGSPLEADFNGHYCTGPTGTWTNEALGEEGAHAASPVDGAVVGWAMEGDYDEGEPFELRVLRPAGGGAYTGIGTSAQVRPHGEFLGTYASFHTDLPIKKGDLIGINLNSDCVGVAAVSGSHLGNWFPALGEGSTLAAPYTYSGQEIGVQAVVQPAPAATSVSPATSALGGGGVVTIQGTDLEEASAVSFGGVPSPSFSVESERQVTAVVPPAATPGPVSVVVTTIAGTATVPQQLAYQACVVPALKGKPAAAAKSAVAAAGCALGKVTHKAAPKPKGKKNRKKAKPKVVAQSRPAGATLPFGAKVDLTVKG
jgi:hypothetical protein